LNPLLLEPLVNAAGRFGVKLLPPAIEQLGAYHDLLLAWNQRINLISRKDTGRIVNYHFLDSLTAVPLIPENASVCDLGSGAGLPGIPVKVVRADITMTLIDATRKKALFLDEVIRELKLEKAAVINARAEDLPGGPAPRSSPPGFDVILCRLLGRIGEVTAFSARLLNPGGRIIFYKSDTAEEEIGQAQPVLDRLHLSVAEIRDYRFNSPEAFVRRLVVVTRNA
jgi:16S rRNA (guanine527-N7)-methyltransferase